MFCPKCGTENPEDGSFCRKCGTDLSSVSMALSGESYDYTGESSGKKGKVTYESAIGKLFMGIAFMVISIILSQTPMGYSWWFWMLIPAFALLGSGVAQTLRLNAEGAFETGGRAKSANQLDGKNHAALPESNPEFVAPRRKYETGDLVPPSVVENTTRHLEIENEGKTMTLPNQED